MTKTVNGAAELMALSGQHVGTSEWKTLTFDTIQAFANATGDHQWIHVDKARAEKESPFGGPIAHGYFTLSVVAGLFFEVLEAKGFKMAVNYGANKVRFPTPLKLGARYRLSITAGEIKPVKEWLEAIFVATIEVEGSEKPACVAECIYRYLP